MIELMDDSMRTAVGSDPGGERSGSPHRPAGHTDYGPGHGNTRYAPSSLSSVIRSILYFHSLGQRVSGSVCPESHALRQVMSSLLFTGTDLALLATADHESAAPESDHADSCLSVTDAYAAPDAAAAAAAAWAEQGAASAPGAPAGQGAAAGMMAHNAFNSARAASALRASGAAVGAAGARERSSMQPAFARSFISSQPASASGYLNSSGAPSAHHERVRPVDRSPAGEGSDGDRTFNLALLTGGRRGRRILAGSDGGDDGSESSNARALRLRTGQAAAAGVDRSPGKAAAPVTAPAAVAGAPAAAPAPESIVAPFIAAPLSEHAPGGCARSIARGSCSPVHSAGVAAGVGTVAAGCGRLYQAATDSARRYQSHPYFYSHDDHRGSRARALAPAVTEVSYGQPCAPAGAASSGSRPISLYQLAGLTEPFPFAAPTVSVRTAPARAHEAMAAAAAGATHSADDAPPCPERRADPEVQLTEDLVTLLRQRDSEVRAIALQRRSHALMGATHVSERRRITSRLNGNCCKALHKLFNEATTRFEANALLEYCSGSPFKASEHSISPLCEQLTALTAADHSKDGNDERLKELTALMCSRHKARATAADAGTAAAGAAPGAARCASAAAADSAHAEPASHHFIMPVSTSSTVSLSCCSVYSHVQGRVFERMAQLRARPAFRHIRANCLSSLSNSRVVFDLQAQQRRDRAAAELSSFAALLHLTSGPTWNRRRLNRLSNERFSRLS